MNANPIVSVIIPTHNHAHFLPECLASVKAQTYRDYEVIVVDNGSTDNTEEVVRNLAWDQLRYYYQDDTGSVAGSRNTGIRIAKGVYVAFLDSDDLWYADKLETVMEEFKKNPDIDILSHDLFLIRDGEKKRILRSGPFKKDMVKLLLSKNPLLGSATVVKKEVMVEAGGFDERKDFVHAEDSDAWLKIAYLGKQFYFVNEAMGEYRVHSANLSHDFESVISNGKNVIEKHYRRYKSRIPFYKYFLYMSRLSRFDFSLGTQYFFRKKYLKCAYSLLRSFFLNPLCFLSSLASLFLHCPNRLSRIFSKP